MKRRWTAIPIALFLALPMTPASADTPTPTPTVKLDEDVAGIRQALDRLVGLLETTQHHQRVDLLLKRIELRERRLDPLERRLRSAQSEVEGLADELVHLGAMKKQEEEELDDLLRSREIDEGDRRELKEIERAEVGLQARLDEAQIRARKYEDELADGREEIEILDEMLLELLDVK